jgi:hypothetical protein
MEQDQRRDGDLLSLQDELVFVVKVGSAPHINNFGLGDKGRYRTNVWDYAGVNTFKRALRKCARQLWVGIGNAFHGGVQLGAEVGCARQPSSLENRAFSGRNTGPASLVVGRRRLQAALELRRKGSGEDEVRPPQNVGIADAHKSDAVVGVERDLKLPRFRGHPNICVPGVHNGQEECSLFP